MQRWMCCLHYQGSHTAPSQRQLGLLFEHGAVDLIVVVTQGGVPWEQWVQLEFHDAAFSSYTTCLLEEADMCLLLLQLDKFPVDLRSLRNLERLQLRGFSSLDDLPANVSACGQLSRLELCPSGKYITCSRPPWSCLLRMTCLKHIEIESNLLVEEHDEVGAAVLPNITYLHARSVNRLCAGLHNLQTLSFGVMPDSTVMAAWTNLTRLTHLRLPGHMRGPSTAVIHMQVRCSIVL